MYKNGRGVVKDYSEAVRWYKLAAEQGNVVAMSNLGAMYEQGQGVRQDYGMAAGLYRIAAEQGVANAQINLGFIYAEGKGVKQDYVTASMWFNLAADQGVKLTSKELSDLAKVMTQEQVKKARDLARECLARKYQGC